MSSSIGQSILMALTVTVNKYASLNVKAVHTKPESKTKRRNSFADIGRRGLLLLSTTAAVVPPQVDDSRTQLLKKYLKKSEENKAKNEKERLDGYYKRNYKDYFEFIEGSLQGKNEQQLSESEKGILDWLRTNK